MSGILYIWDPEQQHPNLTIESIKLAEYYALNTQYNIERSQKFKDWLKYLVSIVIQPNLAENFTEDIISYFSQVEFYQQQQSTVLQIDHLHLESPYFYKILVESLRQYDLVAFDDRAYIFYSKAKIFPNQTQVEQYFASIQPVTAEALAKFKAIPPTQDKLSIFAHKWAGRQKHLNFQQQDLKNIRVYSDTILEQIFVLIGDLPSRHDLGYGVVSLVTKIQLSAEIKLLIVREHYVDGYTLQYIPNLHGTKGKQLPFTHVSQFKNFFIQLDALLQYSQPYHASLDTLNQWLNHGDEKEYIRARSVIDRLALAKYLQDPDYEQLVEDGLNYMSSIRGNIWENMTTTEQLKQAVDKVLKIEIENS